MQQIHSKEIIPVICTLLLQLRLTNEEPDEVGVVLDEKVIQIHQAGESAFIVFGSMPLHGYRQSVCCLKLKNYNISMAALHRNKNKIETRHTSTPRYKLQMGYCRMYLEHSSIQRSDYSNQHYHCCIPA